MNGEQSKNSRPQFPVAELPSAGAAQRLVGLYPQRQPGLFMQRVKAPGGQLTATEWRVLGRLAAGYAGGLLHLTTRQCVELHGLTAETVPPVQRELAAAGLTTVGSCGDTLRNIVVCHGAGLCPGTVDVRPLAATIRQEIEAHPEVYRLPRKFKICLSGCAKACAKPWLSDLGLVAVGPGRCKVMAAGSLGAKPGLGIQLYESLPVEEAVALSLGAVDLFAAEGDRENRRRARLRHVRERLGDDEFRRRLDERFKKRLADGSARGKSELPATGLDRSGVRLQFPLGDVTAALAELIAGAANRPGVEIRIDTEHGVWLYGGAGEELPSELTGLIGGPRVVCCPGADYCASAIAFSRRTAAAIADGLRGLALPDMAVCVSGCPNGCAHSAVAPVGLMPRLRSEGGRQVEFYQILAGGEGGRGPRLAAPVGQPVPAAEVPAAVAAQLKTLGQ
jgi:sulfite reductase beta subunit-like hemoprotein